MPGAFGVEAQGHAFLVSNRHHEIHRDLSGGELTCLIVELVHGCEGLSDPPTRDGLADDAGLTLQIGNDLRAFLEFVRRVEADCETLTHHGHAFASAAFDRFVHRLDPLHGSRQRGADVVLYLSAHRLDSEEFGGCVQGDRVFRNRSAPVLEGEAVGDRPQPGIGTNQTFGREVVGGRRAFGGPVELPFSRGPGFLGRGERFLDRLDRVFGRGGR